MFLTDRFLKLWLLFAGLNSWQLAHGGLVAHWPLNEGSGDVFKDVAGGIDGFLPIAEFEEQAEIEWSDDGPPNQDHAVEFLGANSFIATSFPGIEGNNPRTVAFWVRTEDGDAYFLAWGSNAATEKWHIRTNGGSGVMRTEFQSGQNFANTSVIDGEWHHVASVFPSGASEGEEILHYVDGVLDEQTGGTSRLIDTAINEDGETDWTDANSAEPYFVHFGGVLAHGFGRMLEGSMADVRIYDEELSEEQIRAIFEGDVGVVPPVPFEITAIDYSPADDMPTGAVTITWNSTPGGSYAIDTSTNLQDWLETQDGLPSEGTSTSFTDEKSPGEQGTAGCFYRIRED
jgi:hypothetical protein